MSAKLDKLILDLNGKKIELTLAEAKQLKMALGEILGEDKVVTVPYPVPQPYPVYERPWRWIYHEPRWADGTSCSTPVITVSNMHYSITGGNETISQGLATN